MSFVRPNRFASQSTHSSTSTNSNHSTSHLDYPLVYPLLSGKAKVIHACTELVGKRLLSERIRLAKPEKDAEKDARGVQAGVLTVR
jgi:hypothetical protein